jgi:hypothetical protein
MIEKLQLRLIPHFQQSDLAASSEEKRRSQEHENTSLHGTCSTVFTTHDEGPIQVAKTDKKSWSFAEKTR